ncbi:MAG: hypothetical protein IPL27_19000 [Lewinellaceae bacterium]|nr:hypothetical protein [Lewinellaceae bacterium]
MRHRLLVQFCLALTLGMQVHGVLESSIGHSLEINKLLQHYDHTVLTDFLKVHGASITPLIGQLRWLLLVWLLFSVFIHAGLLVCAARPEQTGGRNFWTAGAAYFFPFLKISLFFLLLALVGTVVLFLPIALFLEPSLQYFSSEKYSVWLVLGFLLLYGFGLIKLYVWSVLSRLSHVETGASTFKSIQKRPAHFLEKEMGLAGLFIGFYGFTIAFDVHLLAIGDFQRHDIGGVDRGFSWCSRHLYFQDTGEANNIRRDRTDPGYMTRGSRLASYVAY